MQTKLKNKLEVYKVDFLSFRVYNRRKSSYCISEGLSCYEEGLRFEASVSYQACCDEQVFYCT